MELICILNNFDYYLGNLLHIKSLKPWGLRDVLTQKYHFGEPQAITFADFLIPMLHPDPVFSPLLSSALLFSALLCTPFLCSPLHSFPLLCSALLSYPYVAPRPGIIVLFMKSRIFSSDVTHIFL